MNLKQLIFLIFIAHSFSFVTQAYEPAGGLRWIDSRDVSDTSIDESKFGCVYRNANKNADGDADWVIDDCDYVGAHYACYNGDQWKVAQALGTPSLAGEPRDGDISQTPKTKSVDRADPIRADRSCKQLFGPSYFFSVPVDKEEDLALGVAISQITAAKKRTWIYYYSNKHIPPTKNVWLGNRVGFNNWLGGNPDNKSDQGGADCVLLDRSTGYWQDENCNAKHAFACFELGVWKLSKTVGQWRDGFSTCTADYSAISIYAVPRTEIENGEIKARVPPSDAESGIDFNLVWLNKTDLAFEEFFIANQTRRSWWAVGQPSNKNNADCTLMNANGDWISESCDQYQAYHACFIGNTSDEGQWLLTNSLSYKKSDVTTVTGKAISSYGFGFCKRLGDHAEFQAPMSEGANIALKNIIKTQLGDKALVWINFSDKASEGAWRAEIPYLDFESATSITDERKDCGLYNSKTNDRGNWVAEKCFGEVSSGFACTNGYEWKVATKDVNNVSLKSQLWKAGFSACRSAFGEDYYFAAPASADENSRLGLALLLTDETDAWLNVNDALNEGVWITNGPNVNLSPSLTLPTNLEGKEKVAISLVVGATDPEGEGIASYSWTIVDKRIGLEDKDPLTVKPLIVEPTLTGEATSNVTISAMDLLNEPYFIDLQLVVTDKGANPSSTTALLTVKVVPPLKAAYDFNNVANPKKDSSGVGPQLILDTSQIQITEKLNATNDYYAKVKSSDSFEIDGNQLPLNAVNDQYTVMYRFKLDTRPGNQWAGFMQKGIVRQPALFYNKNTGKIEFNSTTTLAGRTPFEQSEKKESDEAVRLGQWMTIAFVKNKSLVNLYVDKALKQVEDGQPGADPAPLNKVPDSSLTLLGSSKYDSNNWSFGNVPGAAEGIIGGFDDIRIYDRALTELELDAIFPSQPKGRFSFKNTQESGDEHASNGSENEINIPVSRIEGDDGIVKVGYSLKSESAELNTDFRLKAGQNGILTWGVHELVDKNITVELIGDTIREGTETFKIQLEKMALEPNLGSNSSIIVSIADKTPNIYGAIEFAPSLGVVNNQVKEGDAGSITIERNGDGTNGAVDVWFTVKEFTATAPEHFSIGSDYGFPLVGSAVGTVVGQGKITFPDGGSTTKQTKVINFTTVKTNIYDPNKVYLVSLDKITDVGINILTDVDNKPILGANRSYAQSIKDTSSGRISFKQADYGTIEENPASSSRTATIKLERKQGSYGAICVDFDITGAGINLNDYQLNSFKTTGGGDTYWLNGESGERTIEITAVNDQAYEALETMSIAWSAKSSCNYDSIPGDDDVVTPDTAVPAEDNGTATVKIKDQTNDIQLKFSAAEYLTTEQGSPLLKVMVYATQTADFSDLGALSNKTPFSIYLNRIKVSATEGKHYGNLSGQEVISFNADQTSKEITIPIVDNCDAADNLIFELDLQNDHANLPANNPPSELLKVSSARTKVTIANYSAVPSVSIGYHYDGIDDSAIRANWNGANTTTVTSNISSGQRTPEITQMGVKADVTHACYKTLQYTWINAGNTSPSLPVVSGLANFSLMPTITGYKKVDGSNGGSISSDVFSLPFIIKNTVLNVKLEIVDPEIKVSPSNSENVKYTHSQISGLSHNIALKQFYRPMENYNDGQCLRNNGTNNKVGNGSCSGSNSQLAYNVATKQLVWNNSDAIQCVNGQKGTDLETRNCSSSSENQWRLLNTDEDGLQSFTDNSYRVCEYGNGGQPHLHNSWTKLCIGGSDNWTWYQF